MEGFNIFNHTQFSGLNSTAQFNSAGVLLNGWDKGGTFGTYTASPAFGRIIDLSLRFRF